MLAGRRILDDLESLVEQALAKDEYAVALDAIAGCIGETHKMSRRHRLVCFGSNRLDELCLRVGAAFTARRLDMVPRRGATSRTDGREDLYIASKIIATGGHTGLVGDFRRALPGHAARLLLTNYDNAENEPDAVALARTGFTALDTLVAPPGSREDKLCWLLKVLSHRKIGRVILLTHPDDSAAIAAMQSDIADNIVFVHHSDRVPSLGAYLETAQHVDLTPVCFHACSSGTRSQPPIFAPLAVQDFGARSDFQQPRRKSGFVTASSGSTNKFLRTRSTGQGVEYFAVVALLLRSTAATHFHIGPLPDDLLTRIRRKLLRAGIDPDRFRHVPRVPSLWKAMHAHEVDLYINSFPDPGARASVEVMGSGTPIVWHVTSESTLWRDAQMRYPEARAWTNPGDLIEIVNCADRAWLQHQSTAARCHYEQQHHPDVLAHRLHAGLNGDDDRWQPPAGSSRLALVGLDHLLTLRPLSSRLRRQVRSWLAARRLR